MRTVTRTLSTGESGTVAMAEANYVNVRRRRERSCSPDFEPGEEPPSRVSAAWSPLLRQLDRLPGRDPKQRLKVASGEWYRRRRRW
jgi:hypothetical protein